MRKAINAGKRASKAKRAPHVGNVNPVKRYGKRGSIHGDLPTHGEVTVIKFVDGKRVEA